MAKEQQKSEMVSLTEKVDGKVALMKTGARGRFRHSTIDRVQPKLGRPLEGVNPMYPYENIVLQGGGAKGIVYGGAVAGLEKLGILPYVKRIAAASAGCAPGLMVALGLDAAQLQAETFELNMEEFFDGDKHVPCLKKLFLGWRAFKKMGMHPAKRVFSYFGNMLEKYMGNPDLTFLELYQMNGRELCIVVSNVSRAQSEFCHVNTTPDMPIRNAIRASMSLPILWQPIELREGETFVDGGLFTNFPLKAFDGWFLSTKIEDSILAEIYKVNPELLQRKLAPHEIMGAYKKAMHTSFQEPNMKTIGFRASDEDTPDGAAYAAYLNSLEARLTKEHEGGDGEKVGPDKETESLSEIKLPDTEKAQAYLEKQENQYTFTQCEGEFELAYVHMTCWSIENARQLPPSKKHPVGIDTEGWAKVMEANPPPFSYTTFGFHSWREFCQAFDYGNKGYIARTDLGIFWDRFGVRHPYMKNRKPLKIKSLGGLAGELLNAMYTVAEENLLRDPDNAKRICLLNTKYVGLLDVDLTVEDKAFLFEIGERDTIAWIKKHHEIIKQHGMKTKV